MKKIIGITLIIFVLGGCKSYFKLTGNYTTLNNTKLVNEIKSKIEKKPDQKYLVKEIMWNNECGCGLFDFTKIKKDSYNYFPILVDSKSVYWLKGDSLKLRNDAESLISKFMLENKSKLSNGELELVSMRLKKGVIHFGNTMMRSDLDFVTDSVLINRYLQKNETTIKVRYK